MPASRVEQRDVGAAEAARSSSAVGTSGVDSAASAGAGEVDRVRLARGEITLDQYLDREVLRATGHLEMQAPPAMLESIRTALREQLSTDPVLLALASRISAG